MSGLLAFGFLMCCSIASAQEWHRVPSSFCSEIKASGAKVGYRPFLIFEAPGPETRCCEGLDLNGKGKTEDFGHFRVLGLDPGRYFLSFDLKTKHVNVPISVEWLVEKRYISKDCEPNSKITVDKTTDKVKWEEWVTVD
ncbi:MAG: hypothetical protein ACLPPV_09050 [Candidatus Korobacteraceae bacterium]